MINQGLHPLTIINVHHAMVRHAFLCVDHEHRAPSQPFAQSTPDIHQPVKVQVAGLDAGTEYFYRVTDAAGASVQGHIVAGDVRARVVAGRDRAAAAGGQRHIAAAHAANTFVHVWTINDPADMRRLVANGVDGIVSDRADLLKEVLIEGGRWS